jgi:hypothetical protein
MLRRGVLRILLLLSWLTVLPATAQTSASDPKSDPKGALGWFERASGQMDIRALGSAPFHMKVKFHAFPGMELLPKEKSEIVSGDGVYKETWISPNQWRRAVTLDNYHAIETHSDRARKMQASSDYEPSRVLMLMEALLNPIRRYLLSSELLEHRIHWKIDRSSVQCHPFVRISNSADVSSHITGGTAYVFLPEGLLLQSNESDSVTTWQGDALFEGNVVPKHISIQAGAVRDQLTAEVEVEEPAKLDSAAFDLPGGAADPGMTLRPLHGNGIRPPELIGGNVSGAAYPDMITRYIIERRGVIREFEIIYAIDPPGNAGSDPKDVARHLADAIRQTKFRPAEIDGSPSEITVGQYWFTLPQQQAH